MKPTSPPRRGGSLEAAMLPGTACPQALPMLSAAELQETLATGGSALVAFSAPWCIYELALLPRMAQLRQLLDDRWLVAWVDVTQCQALVQALKVRWVPAVGHVCRGRLARRWYGADVDVHQILVNIMNRERSGS